MSFPLFSSSTACFANSLQCLSLSSLCSIAEEFYIEKMAFSGVHDEHRCRRCQEFQVV